MKFISCLTTAVMVSFLAACGRMDPQSVPDPVSESLPRIIKITVGSGPDTKVNVNVVDNEGVVTFTENDRLFLSETVELKGGSVINGYYWSTGVKLSDDGKSADFYFALPYNPEYNDETVDKITYRAAFGKWEKQGGDLSVTIPASIDLSQVTGSLLPQDGVIAVSDPIVCKPSNIDEVLNGNIRLHHMVSYGILDIRGDMLKGKEIETITVSSGDSSPVAGKAHLVNVQGGMQTDTSAGELQLSFTSSSASEISSEIGIIPSSAAVQDISGNLGTSIWFPTLPSVLSSEALRILLKDANGQVYSGSLSSRTSPDSPPVVPPQGGAAKFNVTNLNPISSPEQ